MQISNLLTDDAILAEIGARVSRSRLDLQMTQADLADRAGVSKRTVERIEAGTSAQMSTMIRVLRALDLLPTLDRMFPDAGPRPIDLLHRKGKMRQRAPSRGRAESSTEPWSWDDDA